jgi:hypothetical protein
VTIVPFVDPRSVTTTALPSWRTSTCVLETSRDGDGTITSRGILVPVMRGVLGRRPM